MTIDVRHGDSRDVLDLIPSNSIDACVTDPPYALVSIVKRFGKEGAAPVNNAGTKAGHDGDPYARAARGFMGQKWDTGEVAHDVNFWREVLRVLKPGAHLIAFGGTRTYHRLAVAVEDAGFEIRDQIGWAYGSGFPKSHNQGDGWGTALKPAWEPIVLARKPLVGTVEKNRDRYGTGAINIDGCRVPSEGGAHRDGEASQERRYTERGSTNFAAKPGPRGGDPAGRWPANIVHDGSAEVVAAFPETGVSSGGIGSPAGGRNVYMGGFKNDPARGNAGGLGDSGSAARFFYSAKADADDRLGSKHPTVKPVDLMAYLCRLVTPPGGTVLDPFAGSGTTGMACMREGFSAILIEREAEYIEDIKRRIAHVSGQDAPLFASAK